MRRKCLGITVIIAFILINALISAEIFINVVATDTAGIPINMLLDIKDIYNNVLVGTAVVSFSILGTISLAYAICKMQYKNRNAAFYGMEFLTSISIAIDAVVAIFARCLVGGYNVQATQKIAGFVCISALFAWIFCLSGGLEQMRKKVD